jgi:hypothetical protein
MTMRATLQRSDGTPDEYGQPRTDWRTTAHVACWVWQGGGRRSQATPRIIEADDVGMIVPLGTDILSGDRVLEVYDRVGSLLYENPLPVDAVVRRRDHLEVRLREHR